MRVVVGLELGSPSDSRRSTKASAISVDRRNFDRRPRRLTERDTLIVWKLDRLARSMKQLIETIEDLRVRGVGFRSLTEALDTTTSQERLVFHMFGALTEFERSLMRERHPGGPAAAPACWSDGRGPPKLTDDDIEAAKAILANPDIAVTQIAYRLWVVSGDALSLHPRRMGGESPRRVSRRLSRR
jgi:DNA invertase Pin-like site-specific DNA recombinase